ncbi:MAG: isochorismatase hydrolase [Hyphomicrobiales bacterium]|jgi:maleamate amidohydrolase|nr:isochorismatase hydrolase [Hyphomicrobiales bacterium]
MVDAFEDHCWKDIIPDDVLELYTHYKRDLYIGPRAALLAIDLYELAYQGGPNPVSEVAKEFPSSCGINAWKAIEPTKKLFAAARAAGLPIFYTTGDTREGSKPSAIKATNRRGGMGSADAFTIRPEWAPQSSDVVITKQRASGFFGTPLTAHLTQLGIDTIIIIGESTSGCVRASTVDGYSNGYHMVMVEECCFDRSEISHKVNLFDLHHKYADVMKVDEVVATLASRRVPEAV